MKIVTIVGEPVYAGAQVFTEFVIPILKASRDRPPIDVQQFYAGLLTAAFGAMSADFGHDGAVTIFQAMVNTYRAMPAASGASSQ